MALPTVDGPSLPTENSFQMPATVTRSAHPAVRSSPGISSTQAESDPRSATSETTCSDKNNASEYGPTPFDEDSDGDCIIKASDGVKYKLYRVVLRLASSVWKDMFNMPQPYPENGSSSSELQDLPFIEVCEPSTTLLPLFRLLYPVPKDQIPTFDLALDLVLAYDKYDIDVSSLVPYLADLLSEASLQKHPLEAYGLAWRLEKGPIVETASRYVHQVELEKKETKDKLLQYSGDFGSLLALHELRYRRELALDDFISRLPLGDYRCAKHTNLSAFEVKNLRRSVRKALGSARPRCWDLVEFLNLREVFTLVAPPSSLFEQTTSAVPPPTTGLFGGFTTGTTVPTTSHFGRGTSTTTAPTTSAFGLSGGTSSTTAPTTSIFGGGTSGMTALATSLFGGGTSSTTAPTTSVLGGGTSGTTAPSTSLFGRGTSSTTAPTTSVLGGGTSSTTAPTTNPSGGGTSGTTAPTTTPFGGGTSSTTAPTTRALTNLFGGATFGTTTQALASGSGGSVAPVFPGAHKPPKPHTCSDCEDALKQGKSESNCELVLRNISRFPQAVTWSLKD
ncbi:hypothetical protein M407DRAFT_29738 [Tulasnella calospora MUT 4182]|uniref:BTB domain-containing protein n=1 Tax=Tulasnella calospora MUT 4182 TaxID=1051891 RepID=A0A0C3Q9I5_9AGAM|nr:hypothetical protein M407DRAFT_29738 [Tulasnella calospora MUT 4182]